MKPLSLSLPPTYSNIFIHNIRNSIELSSQKSEENTRDRRSSSRVVGKRGYNQSHCHDDNAHPLKWGNERLEEDTGINRTENGHWAESNLEQTTSAINHSTHDKVEMKTHTQSCGSHIQRYPAERKPDTVCLGRRNDYPLHNSPFSVYNSSLHLSPDWERGYDFLLRPYYQDEEEAYSVNSPKFFLLRVTELYRR